MEMEESFESAKERLVKAIEAGNHTRITVNLTPEMVEFLLGLNSEFQRTVLKSNLEILKNKILRTGYIFDINPFAFDTSGKLINGQHRLLALKQLREQKAFAGDPEQEIVTGLSSEEAALVDGNKHRTVKQSYFMEYHVKVPNVLIGVVSYLVNKNRMRLTNEELQAILQRSDWKEFLEDFPINWKVPLSVPQKSPSTAIVAALKNFHNCVSREFFRRTLQAMNGVNATKNQSLLRTFMLTKCKLGYDGRDADYERALKILEKIRKEG